ncbi:MAG: hypothetical protein IPJ32_17840 [Sphingobacteriaceae bacterium]|nr:hypothetical protein [Sphingobacteriaceae bacterium]
MKTLIQIVIVAMFGIEICSPFFIGYLNQKQKTKNIYSARETKNNTKEGKVVLAETKEVKNWKLVDFSENNYSDSKTLSIKE